MTEREDIYSGHRIAWRWVLVGTLIVLGTQTLLSAVLAALGVDLTSLAIYTLTTTVAFVVGGAVIGALSPGYTAWEAGYASLLAAAGILFLTIRLVPFTGGLVALTPITLVSGLLCGLGGGWIGERLSGSRTRTRS